MRVNKRIGYGVISLGRRVFVGTPVQRMKVTNLVYDKLFRSMYHEGDVTTTYKNIKLTMPTKDTAIVPSILGGYFESLGLDIFAEAVRKADNVLDVGGNIGLFSIVASKHLGAKGRIYAFEPVAENIEYFQKNVLDNNCKNVELVQEAIGEEPGKLDIFVSKENIGIHSASKKHSRGNMQITVPMTSIDKFVAGRKLKSVGVLKIDIEGYDGYALKGAGITIDKYKPTIFIEYDPRVLKECEFEPGEFADLLFTRYKYCMRVDEVKQSVSLLSREELLSLPVSCNENLVFTNEQGLVAKFVSSAK